MERGFIVDITNSTSEAQVVKLFAGSLPQGVLVTTMDKAYNFDALQMIARQNGFIGDSITTGFEAGLQIEIVSNVTVKKVILHGRYEAPEIKVNGTDEFVLVTCPPNSNFYIRLSMI
jgi:galactitol-specific phosphotransferase system IIC component